MLKISKKRKLKLINIEYKIYSSYNDVLPVWFDVIERYRENGVKH